MCFMYANILLSICCAHREHAEPQLLLALRRIRIWQRWSGHHAPARWRIVYGLVSVLMLYAIVGESGDLAVVAFQRVEIRIGGVGQHFA
jgi:hypothetical protein